jgi:hypothetical protein
MAPATLFPDLATGFAEKMAGALESRRVEDLSADEVAAAIFACSFLRSLLSMARRSIEATLREGVDARAFADRYEPAVTEVDRVTDLTERVAERARTGDLPVLAQEFLADFRALGEDLAGFRQFLAEAVAKAKAPLPPIDLGRVQEAQAAYDRGSTRPFRKGAESHQPG